MGPHSPAPAPRDAHWWQHHGPPRPCRLRALGCYRHAQALEVQGLPGSSVLAPGVARPLAAGTGCASKRRRRGRGGQSAAGQAPSPTPSPSSMHNT